jgi:hypothetical protein
MSGKADLKLHTGIIPGYGLNLPDLFSKSLADYSTSGSILRQSGLIKHIHD